MSISIVLESEESGSTSNPCELTSTEIDFFVEHGYLVKRQIVEEQHLKQDALEFAWSYLLENLPYDPDTSWRISRENTASWFTPKWRRMPPADDHGFYEGRQRINYGGQTIKLHDIGHKQVFLELLPNHVNVRHIAAHLLSADLRESTRTRGVYALLPKRRTSEEKMEYVRTRALGPHTDRVCQQLNVCTYLDSVPPRGGGFTVYPGSHKIMFQAHETESNWSPTPEFRDAIAHVRETITPVEFAGEAGDVIFWHGRTVHSSGVHLASNIRWALFGDFMRNAEVLSDDHHRAVGQYEWFKDTRLLANDLPVSSDMWRGWRLQPTS